MDPRLDESTEIAGQILAVRQRIAELEGERFRLEKKYEAKLREWGLSLSQQNAEEGGRIVVCDGIASVLNARTDRHRKILFRFSSKGAGAVLSVKDIDLLRGGDGNSTAASYGETMNSVKQLLNWGLIAKDDDGKGYRVTDTGFLAAAQMDATPGQTQEEERRST